MDLTDVQDLIETTTIVNENVEDKIENADVVFECVVDDKQDDTGTGRVRLYRTDNKAHILKTEDDNGTRYALLYDNDKQAIQSTYEDACLPLATSVYQNTEEKFSDIINIKVNKVSVDDQIDKLEDMIEDREEEIRGYQ